MKSFLLSLFSFFLLSSSIVNSLPLNNNYRNSHVPFTINGKTFLLLSLDAERPYDEAAQTCSIFNGILANIKSADVSAFAQLIEGKDLSLLKPIWINSFNGITLEKLQQKEKDQTKIPQCLALLPTGTIGVHPNGCSTRSWSLCEVSQNVLLNRNKIY